MKKFKCISIIFLLFIIIFFLQINFFSWFNIAGVMPNLFVLLVLFIGLFIGEKLGVAYGLFIGFILDLLFGKTIGASSLLLAIIGYAGEYFDKNFSKDNKLMIIVIGAFATIFYEAGIYLITYMRYKIDLEIPLFLKEVAIETVYNILLIIILYTCIKKLGYYIQDNYKGRKFLTRYF